MNCRRGHANETERKIAGWRDRLYPALATWYSDSDFVADLFSAGMHVSQGSK
jgi:hypothetical protein